MLNTWLISAVLLLAGASLFIGRRNWHWRWDRLLILSVALQAVGFLLIAPFLQDDVLSRWSYSLTGMALLPDFLGHLCFIASTNAVILAVAYRLLPRPRELRNRIEIPSAWASALMLLTIMASTTPRRCGDIFACPVDLWLRAYWIIFGLIAAYLMLLLVWMLLVVRREYPESHLIANLYIAAAMIGSVVTGGIMARGVTGEAFNTLWMWVPLCVSSGLSFIAGSLTWTRNRV
jgi:hypothetical protein